MLTPTSKLQGFREAIYKCFPKRKDAIMNLMDANCAHGRRYKSVVQLSASPLFERKYSSITDAISDGLVEANWDAAKKLTYHQIETKEDKKPHRMVIDCTPQPRPFTRKLEDIHITHAPNPAPGNKPICVGHQYSALMLLPNDSKAAERHWLVPLSVKRVPSAEKGNEVGMQQVVDNMEALGFTDKLCISIGDSLYGSERCREIADQKKNLIHLFRLKGTRNVFFKPEEVETSKPRKGRKKEFGDKMNLGDVSTQTDCHEEISIPWKTRKGGEYIVTIQCWKDMLIRGSRTYRASEHPFNLIKISVSNAQGDTVYKRPLWLAIWGERRHEMSLVDAYKDYSARYDIEHFFRFGKHNLLMDAYQTPEVKHEESWWKLCMLAYMQLYLAKESVASIPTDWEQYLPEYKNIAHEESVMTSPAQTQRGFEKLLKVIGTPASPSVPRGNPQGRMAGDVQPKRENHKVIFKTKKATKETSEAIVSGKEKTTVFSNPEIIDHLISFVHKSLEKFNLTREKFSELILNST